MEVLWIGYEHKRGGELSGRQLRRRSPPHARAAHQHAQAYPAAALTKINTHIITKFAAKKKGLYEVRITELTFKK